ncbi:hypothetical protein [Niameybacter sp.]
MRCPIVIGAGSVITKDIPDYVVAVGNPCRGSLGQKNNLDFGGGNLG